MAPALLKKDVPALCIECHDVESERARTAHGGYAIAESRCTGCHEPHASAGKKLVADRAHPPFGDRDCSTCHLPPGEKRAKARTKKNLLAECDGCHDFAKRAASVKVPHAPVREGRCFECHTPHASSREHLLVGSGGALCWRCHEKAQKAMDRPFVHTAVRRGECAKCHAIHGGSEKKLLSTAGADLCTNGHDPNEAAAKAKHAKVPPGTLCTSCHDPHAGPAKLRK